VDNFIYEDANDVFIKVRNEKNEGTKKQEGMVWSMGWNHLRGCVKTTGGSGS
jgi:hypothetical protein